jgi:hypothetical protein
MDEDFWKSRHQKSTNKKRTAQRKPTGNGKEFSSMAGTTNSRELALFNAKAHAWATPKT